MKKVSGYISHEHLCELLDVPTDSALWTDGDALIYDVLAEQWCINMNVGTKEEMEQQCEE